MHSCIFVTMQLCMIAMWGDCAREGGLNEMRDKMEKMVQQLQNNSAPPVLHFEYLPHYETQEIERKKKKLFWKGCDGGCYHHTASALNTNKCSATDIPASDGTF
jgi:hypothetical protein